MLTALQPPRKRRFPGNRRDPQRRCCGICTQGGLEFRPVISTGMVCRHHFLPGNALCCHQNVVPVFHTQPSSLWALPVSDFPSFPPFREIQIAEGFKGNPPANPVHSENLQLSCRLFFSPVPLPPNGHSPSFWYCPIFRHPHPSRKDAISLRHKENSGVICTRR